MKRIWFCLMIMLLPMMAVANVNLGIKKADEFIVIPLLVLDSAGVDRKPDSIQILTWLDGGTALQFSTRNTTYPFSAIGIDTSKIFADTTYWFVDQIQDIDGAPTPQNYNLAIDVITWTKVIATHNRATVQVISDSLEVMVDDITFIKDTVQGIIDTVQLQDDIHVLIRDTSFAIIDTLQRFTKPATDTLQGIIDTLQLQDNWVAREASLFDFTADSVIVDFSIWNTKDPEVTVVTNNDKTGYSLTAAERLAISDTVWDEKLTKAAHNVTQSAGKSLRNLNDLVVITEGTAQGGSATTIILAAGTSFADGVLKGHKVTLIGGTGDGQTRHIEEWTDATDSVTLHAGDDWAVIPDATSEYIISPFAPVDVAHVGDSALSEMWNFPLTTITNVTGIGRTLRDTSSAILDSLEVTAMDNLKEAFDDDGVGSTMDLTQLTIVATAANDDAVVITGDGTGHGIIATSGSGATGNAMHLQAASTNGHGLRLLGTGSGEGISASGGSSGDGIDALGGAAGHGMVITGGGTGDGLRIRSGSGATGDGIDVASSATNGVGLKIVGMGAGDGIGATGGVSGDGISAAGGGATGRGIVAFSIGGNSPGLEVIGTGAGAGLRVTAGVTGDGMSLSGGATSGDAFALSTAGSGDLIESAARDEIALSTWNTSALTAFTSGAMGDSAIGGVNTWGQGGAGLTAADIVAIADTVFKRDSSDVNAGAATSFGTLMMKPTYVQGSGSGLDSATHSRIMHRVIWGTSKSAGSDSSTAAERDIGTTANLTTNNDKTGYTLTAAGYVAGADTTLKRAVADTTAGSIFAKITRDASASSASALSNTGKLNNLERAEIHITGAITGTPATTGAASTTAFGAEADDYYNNQVVVFITGTVVGQSTRITDFTNATDSMTFDALTAAPAVGDSFVIIAQYDAGGGAVSISAADMASIIDTLQNRDSTDFNSGGATSYGVLMMKPAYVQGSGSGLDSATHSRIMHRVIWGTSKSAGSDSSTLAERNVTAEGGYVDSITEGDGTASFTYKTVDSTNDVGVQGIGVSAYAKGGQQLGITDISDGNGATQWGFTADDTIIFVTVNPAGWSFPTPDTVFGVTNGGSDSTMSAASNAGAPTGGNECRINGFIYDVLDTAAAVKDVEVILHLRQTVNNTCDSTITPRFSKSKYTGSDGQFIFDVVRSSCLSNAKYSIEIRYKGELVKEHTFTAPDQANFRILW